MKPRDSLSFPLALYYRNGCEVKVSVRGAAVTIVMNRRAIGNSNVVREVNRTLSHHCHHLS